MPWSTWPITVTTGGRGTSLLPRRPPPRGLRSSASSSTPTISTACPSSAATSSIASSESECVAVTISPAMNRIFTISARRLPELLGDRLRRRAADEAASRAGWASGRRDRATAAACAGTRGERSSGRRPRERGSGRSARSADVRNRLHGGLRRRLLGLAGSRRWLEHLAALGLAAVALPPLAREPRDQVLGHARGGRPSGRPHLLQGRQEVLARDAQLLGQLVNPHMSPITRCRSFPSLAARIPPSDPSGALARTPGSARAASTQAPRPGGRTPRVPAPTPKGRRARPPSRTRTTRSSARFDAFPRHPTQVRSGDAVAPRVRRRASVAGSGDDGFSGRRDLLGPETAAGSRSRAASRDLAAGSSAAGSATGSGLAAARPGAAATRLSADLRLGLDVDPPSGQSAARRAFCPSLPIASDSW